MSQNNIHNFFRPAESQSTNVCIYSIKMYKVGLV